MVRISAPVCHSETVPPTALTTTPAPETSSIYRPTRVDLDAATLALRTGQSVHVVYDQDGPHLALDDDDFNVRMSRAEACPS